jgi:hypothetical protein
MVATYTANHMMALQEVRTVIWQPADAATAQIVDLGQPQGAGALMLPIADWRRFHAQITTSLLVGSGPTAFSICAATSAAGAGVTLVVTHAMGSLPNAEGDSVNLECDVEQIREVLATATHVGVWLDCNHNDDETAVVFIRADPFFGPKDGLTADYVS